MSDGTRMMNRMIAVGRRGGGGLIDAVKGADMSGDRQDRLNAAMVRHETACREGREIDAEMADAEIDGILAEARSAREAEASNVGHEAQPVPPVAFDGGIRGVRKFGPSRVDPNPSPSTLMRAAMDESARRRLLDVDVRVPPAA